MRQELVDTLAQQYTLTDTDTELIPVHLLAFSTRMMSNIQESIAIALRRSFHSGLHRVTTHKFTRVSQYLHHMAFTFTRSSKRGNWWKLMFDLLWLRNLWFLCHRNIKWRGCRYVGGTLAFVACIETLFHVRNDSLVR